MRFIFFGEGDDVDDGGASGEDEEGKGTGTGTARCRRALALQQMFRVQKPFLLSCLATTPATASAAQAQVHLMPRILLMLARGLLSG